MSDEVANTPPALRPWIATGLEGVCAIGTAAAFALLSTNIKVNPLDRLGQVAGLASMGFRFMLFGCAFVAALVISAKVRGGRAFPLVSRWVCAAAAGLFSGMVAGGIVVALRGTDWGLNGESGDAGDLIKWSLAMRNGIDPPYSYPPLNLFLLDLYARAADMPISYALKDMQIIGTAMLGPIVYLSWRLVLAPAWALGIGIVAALPLIDAAPYKPYAIVVLLVFLPLTIKLLDLLRRIDEYPYRRIAAFGVAIGLVYGVICLLYSGWFKWSLPGVVVATLIVVPKRRELLGRIGLYVVSTISVFMLIAGSHAVDAAMNEADDKYVYFDVRVDPAYISMYKGDLPGKEIGPWPPPGELAGVGIFAVLMAAGLGLAMALGRGRTVVITTAAIMVGCWLLRFWYAHLLYKTKLVQLYPRTTAEILYCLLVLCGYSAYLAVEKWRKTAAADSLVRTPSGLIGGVTGLLLLFAFAGSAISDHYMPKNEFPPGPGWLSWTSHATKKTYTGRQPTR